MDTARLRYLLSEKTHVNPKNIHAYIIGEHGDSEFALWSSSLIGSEKITDYLTSEEMNQVEDDVRNAAYQIINLKGATYYGIAMCLTHITNAILNNENMIITVSSYDKKNDLYIGMPTIINKNGAYRKMNVDLNDREREKLENSIEIIKSAIKKVE